MNVPLTLTAAYASMHAMPRALAVERVGHSYGGTGGWRLPSHERERPHFIADAPAGGTFDHAQKLVEVLYKL